MPFIPHTEADIKEMLAAIGNAHAIQSLFDEIPNSILYEKFQTIPDGLNENEMMRLMRARAKEDQVALNFIGAGAYEHHIPAAVWDITTRGEFMTAYTPYQAEASQGTLQLLYEFQTMMVELTGMEVSNASLYDGASALAEAVLMAVRVKKMESAVILMPESVHPHYRQTVKAIVHQQNIQIKEVPIDPNTGNVNVNQLKSEEHVAAFIIPQPNFFGALEEVDNLTNWAHEKNILVIGVVNPLSLALLKAPGQWGTNGADIVCGELQPFGMPLSSGGPYAGFLCAKMSTVRQMPGRIVGQTVDKENKRGFTLTLQAREQHIRRGKAMSNICTNQGLLVTAATIYMSLLGFEGLKQTALQCHENAAYLYNQLLQHQKIKPLFKNQKGFFHEFAVQFDSSIDLKNLVQKLADKNILAGYLLDEKQHPNSLLICATETKTKEDLDTLVKELESNI